MRVAVENIQRCLNQKSNIKDVCALVDVKANSDDVFKVFEEIKRSIDILNYK